MPKFSDILQFTRDSNYHMDGAWDYLFTSWIPDMEATANLDLNPEFQRGHVWSENQQIRYCEFILRGGRSSKELYFNCAGWPNTDSQLVLVDGKQRLEAVRRFMHNEIQVFNAYRDEYTDRINMLKARFSININNLETDVEVYQWYLDLNDGGVVHTREELDKVRKMMAKIKGEK